MNLSHVYLIFQRFSCKVKLGKQMYARFVVHKLNSISCLYFHLTSLDKRSKLQDSCKTDFRDNLPPVLRFAAKARQGRPLKLSRLGEKSKQCFFKGRAWTTRDLVSSIVKSLSGVF